jgi:hypothetical protein
VAGGRGRIGGLLGSSRGAGPWGVEAAEDGLGAAAFFDGVFGFIQEFAEGLEGGRFEALGEVLGDEIYVGADVGLGGPGEDVVEGGVVGLGQGEGIAAVVEVGFDERGIVGR